MLSFDELSTLKDDLDLLHASVTERISTLIQESNTLTNWSSEANKRDKTMVCVLTNSFCLQIIKTYNVESGHIQGHWVWLYNQQYRRKPKEITYNF